MHEPLVSPAAEGDVEAAALNSKHDDVLFYRFLFGFLAMLVLLACAYSGVTAATTLQGWARVVVVALPILPGAYFEAIMAYRAYMQTLQE